MNEHFHHSKLSRSLRLLLFITILGTFLRGGWCSGQSFQDAPVILVQPLSQVANYSEDVAFSVTASGTSPVSFQWQKNGVNLVDYDNVAGSQTSTLTLIGVAGNDVGAYRAIASYPGGGSVTSSVAILKINSTIIFADSFESGASNWNFLLSITGQSVTNSLILSGSQNHTPRGAWSLAMSNTSQKVYHNLPVQYDCRIRFSFWFYDDGGTQASCGGELRGYSGPGYARYISPGGLRQILGIGKVNTDFPTNNTEMLAAETLDPAKYQGRILRGTNSGWFNLNANRSIGWHYFLIDRSSSLAGTGKVDFYVDGVAARSITDATMAVVDSLFLGALEVGGASTNIVSGNAYFDDVTVDAFPGLFDWQSLASMTPILDWIQYRETGTNWNVVNVTPSTVSEVNGSSTNDALGDWTIDGTGIYARGIRGYLDYTVTSPIGGAYRVQIEGREYNHRTPIVGMPVEVFIDGESLGRLDLPYGENTNGYLHCFTPFIQAGSHIIRVYWDNVDPRRSLFVQAVRLQDLLTANASSALQPWASNRLVAQNGIEICPASSIVSPVCVEGRGQYLSMMSMVAGPAGQLSPVLVQPGAGHRWYANVPLNEFNETIALASFQNGGMIQSNAITWQVCNLLQMTNNLMIRQGDALLLTATPDSSINGEVSLSIGSLTNFTADAANPVPYQFNQAGTFLVSGTFSPTGANGSIYVTVVNASFEDSPIARIFFSRYWDCTNLPSQVVLDADPRLKVTPVSDAERARQTPLMPPKGPNEQEFRIKTRSANSQYILARLGTNGPILAGAEIRGFRWNISPDTYLRQIAVLPDGSQIVETAYVASPLYTNLSIGTQIISSGVTFEDGTLTNNLGSQDFDGTGLCRLRFVRSATAKGSTCHTTKLYDNGFLFGWR